MSDRLDFLAALKKLVFEPEISRTVKEWSELHKILERETWIFGDTYTLMVSDQSLDAVLLRHLGELGREGEAGHLDPVLREDGRKGIVDLMLGRAHRGSSGREHLVVELKAPHVKIGKAEVAQIKSYAQAVANDPQFRDARVSWDFWVVSCEMDDIVRRDAGAPNRPLVVSPNGRTVYASGHVPGVRSSTTARLVSTSTVNGSIMIRPPSMPWTASGVCMAWSLPRPWGLDRR